MQLIFFRKVFGNAPLRAGEVNPSQLSVFILTLLYITWHNPEGHLEYSY